MRRLDIAVLSVFLVAGGIPLFNQQSHVLKKARQLIIVTTMGWNSIRGEMERFERTSFGEPWQAIGDKIPVVVGRNGMAWGKGLHGEIPGGVAMKKEGDGRSPAGIFALSSAFGYAEQSKIGALGLPYVQAVSTLECVDDVKSAHYNQILDRKSIRNPDWKSSEQMRRQDDLYRLGVVVDHNAKREAGCGSCIFLHIWDGAGKGTAGCTAMEAAKMEEVLRWLDGKKNPILVQLPQTERRSLQKVWDLPE